MPGIFLPRLEGGAISPPQQCPAHVAGACRIRCRRQLAPVAHLGTRPSWSALPCVQQRVHPSHQRRRCCLARCAASAAATSAASFDAPASAPDSSLNSGVLRKLGFIFVAGALLAACLAASHGRVGPPFASLSAAVRSLPKDGAVHSAAGSGWAGLAAGCLHSLSGPDHLAALTPLTFGRGQMKATLLGALWGFGHCIGQLVLGLLLLILKDRFTQVVPALSKYSSVTVALTLMIIGVLGLQETLHTRREAQLQPVGTGGSGTDPETVPIPVTASQAEFQLDAQEQASRVQESVRPMRRNFSLWTLATGVVYGLQPDALFVIIPALALPTPLAAVAYMFMFVVGTVTAMGSYTAFIGATSKALDKNNGNLLTNLSGVASGVAIAVGLCMLCTSCNIAIPGFTAAA